MFTKQSTPKMPAKMQVRIEPQNESAIRGGAKDTGRSIQSEANWAIRHYYLAKAKNQPKK